MSDPVIRQGTAWSIRLRTGSRYLRVWDLGTMGYRDTLSVRQPPAVTMDRGSSPSVPRSQIGPGRYRDPALVHSVPSRTLKTGTSKGHVSISRAFDGFSTLQRARCGRTTGRNQSWTLGLLFEVAFRCARLCDRPAGPRQNLCSKPQRLSRL
jgi:hypothetical protein